jgi:hypothetical protein
MTRFEFNGLIPGDVVYLHHSPDTEHHPTRGVVFSVRRRPHLDNEVGVRIAVDGGHEILWPARLTMHLQPTPPAGTCWRCDALTGTATAA